jgi:hypothetical protein
MRVRWHGREFLEIEVSVYGASFLARLSAGAQRLTIQWVKCHA